MDRSPIQQLVDQFDEIFLFTISAKLKLNVVHWHKKVFHSTKVSKVIFDFFNSSRKQAASGVRLAVTFVFNNRSLILLQPLKFSEPSC